jgi:hypothetical protein
MMRANTVLSHPLHWERKKMTDMEDARKIFEEKFGTPMDMLMDYKPKSVEQLAEWLMMAARITVDQEGKRIFFRLEPSIAFQMAQMMQAAKLKIPRKKDE